MPLTNSLVGYLSFWAERLENKACQGNVFKGARLIHPGAPSVLTSAFCTVQLSHPYRPTLSFDLVYTYTTENQELHKQGDTPPIQEYHRTPKGNHRAKTLVTSFMWTVRLRNSSMFPGLWTVGQLINSYRTTARNQSNFQANNFASLEFINQLAQQNLQLPLVPGPLHGYFRPMTLGKCNIRSSTT